MKFSTKTGTPQSLSTDALILGVFESGAQPAATLAADEASNGLIGRLQKQGDFTGKTGTTLIVRHPEGLKAARLILVGLGKADELNSKNWMQANRTALNAVLGTTTADAINTLAALDVNGLSASARLRQAIVLAGECAYRFDSFKTTIVFSVLVAGIGITVSLLLAVMADRIIRGATFYKTLRRACLRSMG